ncbi:DUF4136 domain-containing protein [Desulfoluna butyratoxydans]|uniref:DUF4136 domain-containing protein n=1 Tax=Desulfoluna butyratoxydans TaxID=231438 RepID=A0A4U8YVP8_9BACT|nr:DUF4136 domain-containing protein [Desulfoluna butyratoxydans]VFQ45483.1 domain of unknown function duf4136 [Desulfoluna butyratoxydans]
MKKRWLWMVAMALVFSGCSGIRVNQDYDPAQQFGRLKSYAWLSESQPVTGDPRIDSSLRDSRTRSAVEQQLRAKGIKKVDDADAAFYLRYEFVLRKKIESSGTGGSVGFGRASHGRYSGVGIGTGTSVSDYDEESLIIDFVGRDSSTLYWRGTGAQRYSEYKDPDKAIKSLNKLVKKVLDQFPPK